MHYKSHLSYILHLLLGMIFRISTHNQEEINQLKCELLTIPVRENQLFDICSLGEEFKISLDIYMKECINARHILTIFDNANGKRLLLIRTHNRREKLVIESSLNRITLKGITRTVNLKTFENNIEIIQKRNRRGRV